MLTKAMLLKKPTFAPLIVGKSKYHKHAVQIPEQQIGFQQKIFTDGTVMSSCTAHNQTSSAISEISAVSIDERDIKLDEDDEESVIASMSSVVGRRQC
jgi:hypothetical protein